MKKTPQNDVLFAITEFLSSDLLQEQIQDFPTELQDIFDLVLETDAGNSLKTRLKMLRIKDFITQFSNTLKPFSEDQVQQSCKQYQLI